MSGTTRINITGSNIYDYRITDLGFEIYKKSGAIFLAQTTRFQLSEEDWKSEAKRRELAESLTYDKNLELLGEARISALDRVRKLYELSAYIPLDIDGVEWDARETSAIELTVAQFIYQDEGLPIVFNDANNEPHTLTVKSGKKLVDEIRKIGLSILPKIQKKNKLYKDIKTMTDIDAINNFNPAAEFGLEINSIGTVTMPKRYY